MYSFEKGIVKDTGRNPCHFNRAVRGKLDAVKFHSLWRYKHLSSRFFFCNIKINYLGANRRQMQQNYKHVVCSFITLIKHPSVFQNNYSQVRVIISVEIAIMNKF